VSHGCIHLYPEDAAEIFSMIEIGTPVRIINGPILIGSLGPNIYLSSYSQVDNSEIEFSSASLASSIVFNYVSNHQLDNQYIDWDKMRKVAATQQNIPIPITLWSPNLEDILSGIKSEPYTHGPY
jgi:L,D-transpeptidase ErfK/SrfK